MRTRVPLSGGPTVGVLRFPRFRVDAALERGAGLAPLLDATWTFRADLLADGIAPVKQAHRRAVMEASEAMLRIDPSTKLCLRAIRAIALEGHAPTVEGRAPTELLAWIARVKETAQVEEEVGAQLSGLGAQALEEGENLDAAKILDAARLLHFEEKAPALGNLGVALRRARLFDVCLARSIEALETHAEDPFLLDNYLASSIALGCVDEVDASLVRVGRDVVGTMDDLLLNLTYFWITRETFDDAGAVVDAFLSNGGTLPNAAHLNVALIRLGQQRLEEAMKAAQQAIEIGDSGGVMIRVGVALARGDRAAALVALEGARRAGVDVRAWRDDWFLRPIRDLLSGESER